MTLLSRICLLSLFALFSRGLSAGEGMWIPLLLQSLNESEMQQMGMKMSAADIYSVNKGSLKDAIVHFGGFCTSEIISLKGLLLTNHHCGYGQIQSHTSLQNNYLRDGFWAHSMAEELPNPGLTATLIVRIEDVSTSVLAGISDEMSESERQSAIDKNIELVKKKAKREAYEEIKVRPFFKGNQYFLFVTVTYRDVRLVGAPPESIGKFGADTDNWVWPRHTGDFSLFRIYAGPDNLPADYSENNVPYQPKHHLPISLDGVAEDDFTLIFGFPGRTNQYLPSYAVKQIVDVLDPTKISIRDKALSVINAAMRSDEQLRIQYASKQARIANAWKKWQGEVLGIKTTGGVARKEAFEKEFTQKINGNKTWANKYGQLLPRFKELYKKIEPYAFTRDYYNEVTRNIELMRVAGYLHRLVSAYEENGEAGYQKMADRLNSYFSRFYKNYQASVDEQVFAALSQMYVEHVNAAYVPHYVRQQLRAAGKDYQQLAKNIYSHTAFTDQESMTKLMELDAPAAIAKIKEDPAYQFAASLRQVYNDKVAGPYNQSNKEINKIQRTYMAALMEVFPDRRFYPDANSTMRVTYGKVAGYEPRDAVHFLPQTYLSGVIAKYKPDDYEFDLPKKLIDLYHSKDYGPYGSNGKMPVCFIGTNHTTGGNSGSPAIDAEGNLIGLNFDRVWEGTMSDINYDASICRNIMVDMRYILFIIDKFAGANKLVSEMTLIHPKKKVKKVQTRESLKKKKKMKLRKAATE